MSNRFYEVGWDVEHLLNAIFEILSALVVILLHGLSSIRLSFLQRVLIRSTLTSTQLPRYSDKQKSNQTTNLEILQKERQQGIERTTTPKEHKRKNDLALLADVRSLDQRTGVVIR
jgi:hypothetical protein